MLWEVYCVESGAERKVSLGYLWVAFDGLRLRPEFALGVGRRRRNTWKEKNHWNKLFVEKLHFQS